MRFAIAAALASAFSFASSATLLAQSDRYGGGGAPSSSGSFDFSEAFGNLPSSQAGGYRSATGPTADSSAAPRPSAGNELRTRSSSATSRPSSGSLPSSSQARSSSAPTSGAAAGGQSGSLRSSTSSPPQRATLPSQPTGKSAESSASATPPRTLSSSRSTPSSAGAYQGYTRQAPAGQSSASGGYGQGYSRAGGSTSAAVPPTTRPSRVAEERADPQAGARERRTRQMLEKMIRERPESQLAGSPMSLASIVSSSGSREEQAQRVEAYWALTSAVADYYLGLAEVGEMSRLRQQTSTYNTALSQAQSNLNTRVETSLKAARAAQYKLSQLMGGAPMPLPSDVPFTGPYATRFDSVFALGAPEEARLIAELLPMRLAELQNAADAVARSEGWIQRVANDQSSGSDGTGVVRALELLALNRRAFVQLARDYNLQINRYTQLASPERVDTGRLVAMLIRTPNAAPPQGDDALMAGFSAGANSSASRTFESNAPSRR